MQVFKQFYKTWTRACYEAFVTVVERKGCHGNISVPVTHRDTGAKEQVCGCAKRAKDGGVLPVTGFPRVDGMENEE